MAHFAKLDENNIVLAVEVVNDSDCLDGNGDESEAVGIEHQKTVHGWELWKQCSYNTREGVHYTQLEDRPVPSEDQSKAFRLNFPGRDWTYDESADAFYAPRPVINGQVCNSWTLNTSIGMWEPPTPLPEGDPTLLEWDEATTSWVAATPNNINE